LQAWNRVKNGLNVLLGLKLNRRQLGLRLSLSARMRASRGRVVALALSIYFNSTIISKDFFGGFMRRFFFWVLQSLPTSILVEEFDSAPHIELELVEAQRS